MQRSNRFGKHINGLAGFAVAGSILLTLSGCESYRGISARSSNETLTGAFLSAALGREGRYADQRLTKWCGTTGILLPDTLPERRRNHVLDGVGTLSKLTAVDFKVNGAAGIRMHYPHSTQERDAVIAVLPVGTPAARRRVRSARCFFVLQSDDATGCLKQADIVIGAELDEASFNHCVVEEFSQAMGLPNDLDAGEGSIFSHSGRPTARTPVDDIFLRVLYDPAVKPGSSRSNLRDVLPGLIEKYR